jgi:hypothetical protein
MPEKFENLGENPADNYWRNVRVKSVELALRESEIRKELDFDLIKRANVIFSFLSEHDVS